MHYRWIYYLGIIFCALFPGLTLHAIPRLEKSFALGLAMDGYLQTPLGGGKGSSSLKQPALKDFGIQTSQWEQLRLLIPIKPFVFYFRNHPIHIDGHSVLKKTLTTYAVIVPKGADLSIDSTLRWQSIGPQLTLPLGNAQLQIELQMAWLSFYYYFQFDHTSGKRAYRHLVPRIVVRLVKTKPNVWQSSCTIGLPFTFSTNLDIKTVSCAITLKTLPTIGAEQLDIHYQDHQDLPNDILLHTAILFYT